MGVSLHVRRIPEETSQELTGRQYKLCFCIDSKAREDLITLHTGRVRIYYSGKAKHVFVLSTLKVILHCIYVFYDLNIYQPLKLFGLRKPERTKLCVSFCLCLIRILSRRTVSQKHKWIDHIKLLSVSTWVIGGWK